MDLQEQLVAQSAGFQNIRFFSDAPGWQVERFQPSYRPTGGGRAPKYLAISGGGEAGAFGAGLLVGWTESGTRPEFDLVTGISAGSLIAPFAFIGSEADPDLKKLFGGDLANQLNSSRSIFRALFGESVLTAKPLRNLIDEYVTPDLLEKIARRHRDGARLLVVSTNLDAERSVVWDMGAIAASGHPEARELFARVLSASASIPGVFPPVPIAAIADGELFEELHVDGGAIRQIFFFPLAFYQDPTWSGFGGQRPTYYAIANHEIMPRFQPVEDRTFDVAQQSYRSLIKANIFNSLAHAGDFAAENGMGFRMAFIDRYISTNPRVEFDPQFMAAAFALGKSKGLNQEWSRTVPIGTDLLTTQPPVSPTQ